MPSLPRPAVLELIGNTPLVKVSRFDTGPCTLFLKLESQNPGGSIKDRIGLAMIDAAERDGRLQPGGTIIEATAGNTVGYNYNHTKVTDVKANPAVLDSLGVNLLRVDRREKSGLLGDTTPEHKLSLGNDFTFGNWALHSNLVRYGEFTSYQATKVNDQTFKAAWCWTCRRTTS